MLGLQMGVAAGARLSALSAPIKRYFPTFDPVLNGYGVLDTAFTPAGDFEVEVTFALNSLVGDLVFVSDGVGADAEWLRIDATNGSLDAKVNGLFYANDGAFTADNNLNIAKFTRIGSALTITLNGSTVGSHTVGTAAVSYKMIGRRGGVTLNYFDGIIVNVKLTDLATPANSRIFPLALGPGSSVENSTINSGSVTYTNIPDADRDLFTFDEANQRWVGDEELLTNGNFATDTNWTKGTGWSITGGQAVCTSPGGDSLFYQSMVRPSRYLVEVDIAELVGDGLEFYDGSSYSTSTNVTTTGVSAFAVTNGNTGYNFFTTRATAGDTSIKVNSMSVKRLLDLP